MNEFGNYSDFTVGSVLSNSWRILWKKPVAFLLITFLSGVISIIMGFLIGILSGAALTLFHATELIIGLTAIIGGISASVIVAAVFQGAITYAIFRLFMSGRASMWESFKRSANRALAVFAGAIIVALAILAVYFAPVIAGSALLFSYAYAAHVVAVIVIALGMLAAGILTITFMIKWSVFVQSCVIERTGPLDSLKRSSSLTQGYRLKILGVYLLSFIILIIAMIVVRTSWAVAFGSMINYNNWTNAAAFQVFGHIVVFFAQLIPSTFISILPSVIYYSLRVTKEGLAPESLADIFE